MAYEPSRNQAKRKFTEAELAEQTAGVPQAAGLRQGVKRIGPEDKRLPIRR
jgi:hypothetical protein